MIKGNAGGIGVPIRNYTENKPPLRGIPHHIVITNPVIVRGRQLTRCNVD